LLPAPTNADLICWHPHYNSKFPL